MWTSIMWFRRGKSGGFVWALWWAVGLHQMGVFAWLAEELNRFLIRTLIYGYSWLSPIYDLCWGLCYVQKAQKWRRRPQTMEQRQWRVRKESRLCQVRTRRRLQKEWREQRRKGESAAAVRCHVRGGNIGEAQGAAITHITATARAAIAVCLATMYLPAEGLESLHLPRYEWVLMHLMLRLCSVACTRCAQGDIIC